MTRERFGWGLVCAASLLLVLQVLAGLTSRGGQATAPTPSRPKPQRGVFQARRLAPSVESLFVVRSGSRTPPPADLVGWDGEPEGTVTLSLPPPQGDGASAAWGRSQSPSGARFIYDGLLLGIDGGTTDLRPLLGGGTITQLAWRDDSSGACAIVLPAGGPPALLELVFNPRSTGTLEFGLPGGMASSEGTGLRVLACSGLRRTATVGASRPDGTTTVVVLDLVTGELLGRRELPVGTGSVVSSPDGKLLAVNGVLDATSGLAASPKPHRPVPDTVVQDLDTGRVLRDLGPGVEVRAFSADSEAVLLSVDAGGTSIVRLDTGRQVWHDASNRRLLGWEARPYTHDFAVALGAPNLDTCTRGEPGKFPEFCSYQPVQDLEIVRGDSGSVVSLGRGVGAWGYDVP